MSLIRPESFNIREKMVRVPIPGHNFRAAVKPWMPVTSTGMTGLARSHMLPICPTLL